MTSAELLAKAVRALESAELFLAHGDLDGAVNRAYYGGFNAARAALVHEGALHELAKTHATVIGLFGRHLVQSGRMPADHGRLLNRCHQLRNLADYDVAAPDGDRVAAVVTGAGDLLAAVQMRLGGDPRGAAHGP
ncbi:HEPN domain-containing protein [Azospirillum sp. ST 5-10]|uniref:HEPN domain-containing protein n=1 Tax=unclassified Azospirillum TaxID=2630922 RepID=UPI003F4A0A2D